MSLAAGAKLGPYEIQSPLGAGGMGEVYRARDTRLDRTVAIKILPAHLSANPEAKQRFEREAKAISSLSHPNICALYDVGAQDGVDFLVMEYLEGETLADRLKKGALPLDQLLRCGMEIANGLDKAHRSGVVHRDLKPGNIMLTKTGAKLMDFGLAKSAAARNPALSAMTATINSPAASHPLTAQGTVVGTFQYMSPEQVEGKDADERSDIFALGAVLYEMLTGQRAFEGKSQLSVASAILEKEPAPISSVKPLTPPALDHVIRKCLAKEQDKRWQTAADISSELQWIGEPGSQTGAPSPVAARQDSRVWMALAAAALVAALALGALYFGRPAIEAPVVRLAFIPPPNLSFNDSIADQVVVSPDGRKLAFSAISPEGKWQLWVRALDSLDAQPLPGADEPLEPFWSPDSRSIAFGSQGKLKRVDLAGGSAQVLCDAARLTGGAWNNNGVIVFGPDYGSALFQVPATGGQPKPVTVRDAEHGDRQSNPSFLPDGKHFIFKSGANSNTKGIWAGSLDSPEVKQVMTDNTIAAYAPLGWLLFVRNQAVMAQAFDAGRLELKGDAIPIITRSTTGTGGSGRFSVSDHGVLVWQGDWGREYQLVWFDREGKQTGVVGASTQVSVGQEPHLSPDGKRLAMKRDGNIWLIDLARNTGIRLTSVFSQLPIWSPDGKYVAFTSSVPGIGSGIVQKDSKGVGDAEMLWKGINFPHAWSPDGRFILFLRRGEKTRLDAWVLPLFGDRKEYPVLNSEFDERDTQFSPDGRWLAYASDESGGYEIYVRPFTADGKVGADKKRISTSGGIQPTWRGDGQELFYVAGDQQMMSVAVKTKGAEFEYSAPKALFKTRMLRFQINHEYEVAADGKHFLIGTLVGDSKSPPPTVILNWTAELKKK